MHEITLNIFFWSDADNFSKTADKVTVILETTFVAGFRNRMPFLQKNFGFFDASYV